MQKSSLLTRCLESKVYDSPSLELFALELLSKALLRQLIFRRNYLRTPFVVVVQLLSPVWLFLTPWTAAHQAQRSHYLPEFAQIHIHWVIDAIEPSSPLPLPFPFAFSLSNEYSGLIFLELACLISLQFKGLSRGFSSSSKASVFRWSAFFMVQLSHLYYWKHHNFDYMDFGL